jgi:murein DD-endopeptidase MepM/ murein hydrolase activator NlpD
LPLEDSPSDVKGVIQPSQIEQHYKDLTGGIQKELSTTKRDLEILLQKQMRLEVSPLEGPGDFLGLENTKSREKLKNLFQASIKMKALQLEHLQKQNNYLSGEMKLGSALKEIEFQNNKFSSKTSDPLSCQNFPLQNDLDAPRKFTKLFEYGQMLNPELGTNSPKSQGLWWGDTFGTFVQVCHSGEVVLAEYVEGRGYVVGVKHNAQFITLYGNLDPLSTKTIKVGMKVPRGLVLGVALDKFYFEARKSGESVDPVKLFSENLNSSSMSNSLTR